MKKLTFILSITLTLSAFAQVPSYVPSNGLVGWWPFNGNANDESGNSLNCTIFGSVTPTDDRFGNSNSAYLWPSNGASGNYMFLPNFTSFLTNSYSISFWMLMDGGSLNPRVLSKGEWVIGSNGIANTSRTMNFGGGYVGGVGQLNLGPIDALEWVHVVWSADGSSLSGESKVYFNGVLHISSCCHDGNIYPNWTSVNPSDFNIGRKSTSAFDGWGGKIDDIGIWNRALTPCEISELYNAQSIHITADAGLDESVCNGEALTLTATENSGITQTMNVTAASSSDYTFAGDYTGADPNITAEFGDTLVFNINSPSHPFWLKTAPVTGTGSAVAVANNGTGNGTISWIPDVAGTYYYICQFHSGMTGTITVLPSSTSISWINGITNGVSFTPTNSGYYTATATNGGCSASDSLFVTVNQPTSSSITASDCDSYIAPDGATYSATGNYTAVIPNAVGCDSTISIDLTITNSTTGSETITECNSFTWGANNQTYTATGQYTAVLANAVGCDSTVTLNLTINNVDNGITQVDDFTLEANASGATYQWIDCTDNSPIVGGTNQQFIPTQNGDYAVIVTQNGCSDTTACLNVVSLNLLDNDKPILTVYPNPAKETITISSDASIVGKDFSIINQLGQAVILGKIVQQEMSVDLSDLATGVYVIRIDGVEKSSFRVVKE